MEGIPVLELAPVAAEAPSGSEAHESFTPVSIRSAIACPIPVTTAVSEDDGLGRGSRDRIVCLHLSFALQGTG